MDATFSKTGVFPLLSPTMESKLLQEPWPQAENYQREVATVSNPLCWEENYQDLSDWCVNPRSIDRFHIPPPLQGQQDYHIGEHITSMNSGVKDNYGNLSHIKSELIDIPGIGDNSNVDNNIRSTGMTFEGSLPIGQDQFNTITDISDVWLDLLPTTSAINEQQTTDSMRLISNRNEHVPDSSLDLISGTIDTWFPIQTDNNTPCNDLVINNQSDDAILDSYQSTSANSTDDKDEKKQLLSDALLTVDVESEAFDLLSYVCDESGGIMEKRNSIGKPEFTASNVTAKPSHVEFNNKSKLRRERKHSEVRAKAEPYVPPLKINMKTKSLIVNKRRPSKQTDQESGNYTDSDSDAHTSDYSYRELRDKNNQASRKSRINKKVKETEMQKKANDLERDNVILKMKVEELEKLVTSMRTALLQSALKKEN